MAAKWTVVLRATDTQHLADIVQVQAPNQGTAELRAREKLNARRLTSPQRDRWNLWLLISPGHGVDPEHVVAWGNSSRTIYTNRYGKPAGASDGTTGLPGSGGNQDSRVGHVSAGRPARLPGGRWGHQ